MSAAQSDSRDADAPAIEVDDLCYRAPDGSTLIDRVSLSVQSGEIVALAGPNGAGKTTLLKLMAGLAAPSSGEVRLFGEPIAALPPRDRARRLAFVGQRDSPDPRLRAEDYVALGRIPHQRERSRGEHVAAVDSALAAVDMTHKRLSSLGRLSGGELQRLTIARALCQQPDILYLDEPTNHLDPRTKGELLSLVAGLGITVVCVLHELTLIPSLASHTVLVDQASLVASGPTAETLTGAQVMRVFGVDFFELDHPTASRSVPILDIPIAQPNQTPEEGKQT